MRNQILHGDCLDLMKDIPDGSVDMILCDLPYGTTQNKWDSIIDLPSMWSQYRRVIKPNGAIVLTAQTPFDKILGASMPSLLKYEWIWCKNNGTGHLNAKKMPLKKHENILVFYNELPVYNAQNLIRKQVVTIRKGKKGNGTNYGKSDADAMQEFENYPDSLLYFNREMGLHPTQKPVALFEYLIKTYTQPGDLVLDNGAGSGTTGVACQNTGRDFILIEKDPGYHDIIWKRLYPELF